MSYWVSSQTPIGVTNTTPQLQLIKYHFEVDEETDLPAQNAFSSDGVKIAMTSTAHVIKDNSNFEMMSDGTWSTQAAGTAGYTKSEVDALLADKEDTLTFDAAPTENSLNPVTSNGIFQAFSSFEIPVTIPGSMSIYDLQPGWWSRVTNLSQVTDTPSDYSGGYICHVVNQGIGTPRRKMITFYPISASNAGSFYRAVQTSGGWSSWYRYDGSAV